MEDNRLEELLQEMKEERIELPQAVVEQTKHKMKRNGLIATLVVTILWGALFLLFIGGLLAVFVPSLRNEWIWTMALWTLLGMVGVQLFIIWGLRNREELQSLAYIRTLIRGGRIYE
ncbi:hypothetical protein [Paenibacillus marinisediminis]